MSSPIHKSIAGLHLPASGAEAPDRGERLLQAFEAFEVQLGPDAVAEFVAAVEQSQKDQLPPQERPGM
jgi:hypothetical protein